MKQLDLISLLLREEERMEDDHGDDADELHVFRSGCPTPDDEGMRVCPWVSCRHHLALDVRVSRGRVRIHEHAFLMKGGVLQLNTGAPMCSMDVADAGGVSLEVLGDILGGVTRERARQLQDQGVAGARHAWALTTGEAIDLSAEIPRTPNEVQGSRPVPRWMAAARKHGAKVREKKKAAIKKAKG